MASYQSLIEYGVQALAQTSDTPRLDTDVLLQFVTKQSLAWLIAHANETASEAQSQQFYDCITRRQQHTPIAYITGEKEFWSLKLNITPDVLIPRADTETLVEQALKRIDKHAPCDILDLGTGSGAIALAIAKERPNSSVIAVDYSIKALKIAEQNAQLNQINNIEFRQSNWFENIQQSFNLIVSNPPYIAENDPHLKQLKAEPQQALASPQNGLADIQTIIKQSRDFLKPNSWLIIEHSYDQEAIVQQLLHQANYQQIQCHYDLNQLPRVSCAHHQ